MVTQLLWFLLRKFGHGAPCQPDGECLWVEWPGFYFGYYGQAGEGKEFVLEVWNKRWVWDLHPLTELCDCGRPNTCHKCPNAVCTQMLCADCQDVHICDDVNEPRVAGAVALDGWGNPRFCDCGQVLRESDRVGYDLCDGCDSPPDVCRCQPIDMDGQTRWCRMVQNGAT